eukprot:TRINITY_DN9650_c0_g2_i1.p1 TRINITY_DN9650_c0_g2~~TRINITY_DN9650_c0_g2_i1.p1  ORF type:complete len:722 (-),score=158.27 TRINITY_DN9650_c0_g2_i1:154-2238(-)
MCIRDSNAEYMGRLKKRGISPTHGGKGPFQYSSKRFDVEDSDEDPEQVRRLDEFDATKLRRMREASADRSKTTIIKSTNIAALRQSYGLVGKQSPPPYLFSSPQAARKDTEESDARNSAGNPSKRESQSRPLKFLTGPLKSNPVKPGTSQGSKLSRPIEKGFLGSNNTREALTEEFYKCVITSGNNSGLVRKVLLRRPWWREVPYKAGEETCQFMWQPTSKQIKFDRLRPQNAQKQMVNHYEFHREISMKNKLIKNLQVYCEMTQTPLHELTPTTFIIELENDSYESDLQLFIAYFYRVAQSSSSLSQSSANNHNQIIKAEAHAKDTKQASASSSVGSTVASPSIDAKHKGAIVPKMPTAPVPSIKIMDAFPYCQPKIYPSFFRGYNLWLLKPCEYNRGRGIKIFNSVQVLKSSVYEYFYRGIEEAVVTPGKSPNRSSTARTLLRSQNLVIQKYVENPLLIENRKFDIRVWVLVDHEMNLYWFKEGYIRTSSEAYTLSPESISNQYVHLTNNAVQKNSENYGKFENGNQIALSALEKYLQDKKYQVDFKTKIIGRIKELIKISMNAVRNKLNMNDRRHCFEIFGYDFIIDNDLNVWLIEVNTNPCIEESSPLLRRLIPRMIDDALKLTVDVIFPYKNLKQYLNIDTRQPFGQGVKMKEELLRVEGYREEENIWELLDNLARKKPIEHKLGRKLV